MNFESIQQALHDGATLLGYHPTSSAMLHRTLSSEGFPIALIATPKVVKIEGERERTTTYYIGVNFLCANSVDEKLCAASIARLATDCERFLGSLSARGDVMGLEVEEILAVSGALTVAGEVGLSLKAKIKTLECRTES